MHPIERLRFVARDSGAPDEDVVAEAAAALARFAEEVLPLYDSCGACHGSGSQRDGDGDTIWPAAPESPSSADVEAYFHEFEDAVVWGEPEQSVFLAASRGQVVSIQHPEAWAQDTPADRQVAAFIRETTIPEGPPPGADMGPGPTPDQGPPEEDDMGAGPAPGVPCEGLPVGDPLGRAALFEQFEADINPLLVDSCAEGICHGTPGNGGAYWLAVSSPCSVQWNYTVSLTFIDYQDADRSPLTALPVSSDHGGRQVFNGREDPRFTRLLAWVRAAAGSP
ncbi:MAG: hypothetical protein KC613_19775 [Myxococcales bacterium]|nr:hypothetical protein [Myxococcales bacterium]